MSSTSNQRNLQKVPLTEEVIKVYNDLVGEMMQGIVAMQEEMAAKRAALGEHANDDIVCEFEYE